MWTIVHTRAERDIYIYIYISVIITVVRLYICFHFHAVRCTSVAVTEVSDMFLILHCKSHKHWLASDQIPICAGLLLRITPGNSIDVGECVDVDKDITGSSVFLLIVNSLYSCASESVRSLGHRQ